MQTLILPRGCGKSTQILRKVLKDPNAIMLVANCVMRDAHRRMYPDIKNQIFAWHEWRDKLKGVRKANIYIDNIDIILDNMFQEFIVKGVSITTGERLE